MREPALQRCHGQLAAFNRGLCLPITRALPPRAGTLEHLSSEAGAKLLRARGFKGG